MAIAFQDDDELDVSAQVTPLPAVATDTTVLPLAPAPTVQPDTKVDVASRLASLEVKVKDLEAQTIADVKQLESKTVAAFKHLALDTRRFFHF